MAMQKKKAADKLSNTLWVKMTERDRAIMDRAAQSAGMETSTFVRIRILDMIRKDVPLQR